MIDCTPIVIMWIITILTLVFISLRLGRVSWLWGY